MAKTTEHFVCRECGYESTRWLGKCPNCNEWNSFGIFRETASAGRKQTDSVAAVTIEEALTSPVITIPTGEPEIDRVLGGGLVPGAVFLLAGEPGIGKSTLLLTLAGLSSLNGSVAYLSGEETAGQIARRAKRLGINAGQLRIIASQSLDAATPTIQQMKPKLLIVDSVQTIGLASLPSALGSVAQIREVTLELGRLARLLMIPVVLVGHVTKEGDVAGPKVLEHLVDAVLLLEGDRQHDLRLLRTMKNRFGATEEVGVFTMAEQGLLPVSNPSARFLDGRDATVPGSSVVATLEGTRAILVELQALVQPTQFGYPKRTASGFDSNRLQLLLAVLEQRAHIPASRYDVYLNVVGGIKLHEPGVDLGVCLAIASAIRQIAVPNDLAVWGEVGLSGEIRKASSLQKRAMEAKRLGYTVRDHEQQNQLAAFIQRTLPSAKRSKS